MTDVRVVVMDVDAKGRGLQQGEEVNGLPLQDVCGGHEELVKAPAALLVRLQYAREHRHQLPCETPRGEGEGERERDKRMERQERETREGGRK